jgi:hypothetical protein
MESSNNTRMARSQPLTYDPTLPKTAAELTEAMKPYRELEQVSRWAKHRELSTNLCAALYENAKAATYPSMPTSNLTFSKFAELIPEIRARIWQLAALSPRIVEFVQIRGPRSPPQHPSKYRPRDCHAVLQACAESRAEALRCYAKLGNPSGHPHAKCIRYNSDIAHIRDWNLSWDFHPADQTLWPIEDGKFDMRTGSLCFRHIEALAVSRDMLLCSKGKHMLDIRDFFPKLRLLILLIDDRTDIGADARYTFTRDDYDPYDIYEMSPYRRDRLTFIRDATGPLKEVVINKKYEVRLENEYDLETWIEASWDREDSEDEEYHEGKYYPPRVVVMGCSLP